MTNPNPDDYRTELQRMPRHVALALRQALALDAGDATAAMQTTDEIRAEPDGGLMVGCTSSSMLARMAYELSARTGHTADAWLHTVALGFLDQVQARLDGGD
jgi:hypothetical protein